MPKPICVTCRCFYSCERNETFWEEGMPLADGASAVGATAANRPGF